MTVFVTKDWTLGGVYIATDASVVPGTGGETIVFAPVGSPEPVYVLKPHWHKTREEAVARVRAWLESPTVRHLNLDPENWVPQLDEAA